MILHRAGSGTNYDLIGTYTQTEANFTGSGEGENDFWWTKETYTFNGNAI
jgi:hypothetical protein